MASKTRYFGLGFFDFGDPLNSDWAAQVEIDRFIFLDKEIFGLMSIMGNGVVDGWKVETETSFSVSISEGFGNINFIAGRTTFPISITDLPPNSTNYVFAKAKLYTTFAEEVDFVLFPTKDISDPNFLLLAEVTTGPSSITSIDNDIRQEIQFIEIIKAAIKQHKHRGGALNPSKIDLTSDVQGQLPSFHIAPFDAEKVSTGTFDLARLPLLDHQELTNIGLLTHGQLDSFVKTLINTNKEIFGEIGGANLLQLILAMKLIYDDPKSAFYLAGVGIDHGMINELSFIPGITSSSYIDFENTTAEINTEQHYIKGVPPKTGTSFYVTYNSGLAWKSAYSTDNLIIVGNTITLAFDDNQETNILTIEGFESATAPGQSLTGQDSGITLFKKETVLISDNADIKSEASSTNVMEGFYSGKFTSRQSFRTQYVKEFTSPQDWSTYDSFVVNVKCLNSIHGSVRVYLEDAAGNKSVDYIILSQDEITSNSDTNQNDFELRVIDLSNVSFRNKIKRVVFFTDDLENPFSFFIDFINIQRAILLPEQGQLKLRFSSNVRVIFSSLNWTSVEPSGTSIQVRARASDGTAFLPRADFTPFLVNSSLINLEGTDLEIEVTFHPDSNRIYAPILLSMKILILTESDIDGFVIDDPNEFEKGVSDNISISTSPTELSLSTPIYVDSYYFALSNTINQIKQKKNNNGSYYVQGELGIFGSNTPIAPNQILKNIENGETKATTARLFEPRSVRRTQKRTFIIADTYNDRVLEMDENQNLITGVGSINYQSDSIYPLAASFDVRTNILYIVWSKPVPFKTVNVSKIIVQSSNQKIQLIRDFDKIKGLTTDELTSIDPDGQIMPIHLSPQNAGILQHMPSNRSFALVSSDVMTSPIETDSVFYRAITTSLGIPVFIGNFAYIDGIFSPTWAEKTESDSFIVTNATIAIKDYLFPTDIEEIITKNSNVSSIIEIDKNNNVVFGSNAIEFSPFIPGRAERIDTNTLLLGGLKSGSQPGVPTQDAPLDFRTIHGSTENKDKQKKALQTIFFGGTKPYVGAVTVLDTRSNASLFEYTSPEGLLVSDVDVDINTGEYVVAESSIQKSGRIIKLDSVGNIVFSFGEGLYSLINDITVQIDGSIVIST